MAVLLWKVATGTVTMNIPLAVCLDPEETDGSVYFKFHQK